MKWLFILMAFLIIVPYAGAQNRNNRTRSQWYQLTGTIGSYPVSLQLYRFNDNLKGTYYYHSVQQPIELYGTMDKESKIILIHYDDKEESRSEKFEGTMDENSFSGIWQSGNVRHSFLLEENKDGPIRFDYIYSYGSRKIPLTPFSHVDSIFFDAESVWPVGLSGPLDSIIKNTIRAAFGAPGSREEIGAIFLRNKKSILYPKAESENGIAYESSEKMQLVFQNDSLLCLSETDYAYYGGAHGIYGTTYYVFDLAHQRRLMIDDILDTISGKAALERLLEKAYRSQYHINDNEPLSGSLFADTIPVTSNFILTGKSIGFSYQPYEIGPYALGEITIYLPLEEIKEWTINNAK